MSWLKHFSKNSSSHMTLLVVLLLAVAILTPFMSYLGTVFGWTNPDQAPPGGSGLLTRSGSNLGINTASPSTTLTVSGTLSVAGNRIRDVATPVAGGDGVNKDYVDAQVSGGGLGAGVTTVTLYGVSSAAPTAAGVYRGPGGAIAAGLRVPGGGVNSYTTGGAATNPPVAAGSGTPACTSLGSGWGEVFAGFGPLNMIEYFYATPSAGQPGWPPSSDADPGEQQPPSMAVALSDSICSTASFAYVPSSFYIQQAAGNQQLMMPISLIGACNTSYCNTCRVCLYTYTTSTP